MRKIQKLQSQISEIDTLLNKHHDNPEFTAWKAKTERVLTSVFGAESLQTKGFRDISFMCGIYYEGMPDSDNQNAYNKGLTEAKLLLEGMLDEIDEEPATIQNMASGFDFWNLMDQRIIQVSQMLFNHGHYASAVFEATKLLNNEIKVIVQRASGEEFDGADLMNRAFSLTNPIILLGDLSSETGKNMQKGYMDIYRGTMSAVRNPKGHENIEIDKKKAIHFLFLVNLLLIKLEEKNN